MKFANRRLQLYKTDMKSLSLSSNNESLSEDVEVICSTNQQGVVGI